MPLPGDPDALEEACRQLRAAASSLQAAGESVAGHGRAITADWTGLAAPLALARVEQDAATVRRVAEAVAGSLGPLSRYAEELRAAQQDYARGESMVVQGRAAAGADPVVDPAMDRAGQARDDGTALMRAAEERARLANEAAAKALDAASSSLAGIAPPPTPPAAAATTPPLAELGNSAASLGNAILEHPSGLVAALAGGGLVAVSATGVLASAAVSLTGGGAVLGVPGAAVSAAGVATGVGIAGAGLLDLSTHAATDSSVAPFQVDQKSEPAQGPAPFPPPAGITGKTKHGEEQAESRNGGHGVSDEAMEDAVANPVKPPQFRPTDNVYRYTGKDAIVSLNDQGEVVTSWPRNSRGYRYP